MLDHDKVCSDYDIHMTSSAYGCTLVSLQPKHVTHLKIHECGLQCKIHKGLAGQTKVFDKYTETALHE